MSNPASPASPSEQSAIIRARKQYCEEAVGGALHLFSPWSATPAIAADCFAQALRSAKETMEAPPLGSHAWSSARPKLSIMVAAHCSKFDSMLSASPRPKSAVALWRSLLVDAYASCSAGMTEVQQLTSAHAGPEWLVEDFLAKHPASEAARWAAALSFAKRRPAMLPHAQACAPRGSHLFSTGAALPSGSLCSAALDSKLWAESRKLAVAKFGASASFPDQACKNWADSTQSQLWRQSRGAGKAHAAAFASLAASDAPFDAAAAVIARLSAPKEADASIGGEWIAKLTPGALRPEEELFCLLWCPPEHLGTCCSILSACAPARLVLIHAALARLSGAPVAERPAVAKAASLWIERAAACGIDVGARIARKEDAKTFGSDAFELAIRAALQNRSASKPGEAEAIRAVLERLISLGHDPSKPLPNGALTCMAKLGLSKAADSTAWLSWAEGELIRSASSEPESSAKRIRL